MKPNAIYPALPVLAIALGTAAIAAGTLMIILHERERQRREPGDDPLADTAEVDALPDDIAIANEEVDDPLAADEPSAAVAGEPDAAQVGASAADAASRRIPEPQSDG